MNSPAIVLASTSPARIALFRAAGIACTGVAPDADESTVDDPDPVRRAEGRAALKARSVDAPGAIVIAADQVAWIDGIPFGKPRDIADHRSRLRQLRGREHTLSTAVVMVHPTGEVRFVEHTRVRFRGDLSDEELDTYVATGEGSGCAGGYAAEGNGAQLIAHIEGDWFNVLGIPLLRVITALRELGWRPPYDPAAS